MIRLIRLTALMCVALFAAPLFAGCSAPTAGTAQPPTQQPAQPGQQSTQQPGATTGKSEWHVTDADKSHIDDAAKKGVPAVIKLGSDSCSPCVKMKPVMEELARFYAGKVMFFTVDVYKHADLALKYQVQVIPKIIFVDSTGKAVAYTEGYHAVNQMKSLIEKSGILK